MHMWYVTRIGGGGAESSPGEDGYWISWLTHDITGQGDLELNIWITNLWISLTTIFLNSKTGNLKTFQKTLQVSLNKSWFYGRGTIRRHYIIQVRFWVLYPGLPKPTFSILLQTPCLGPWQLFLKRKSHVQIWARAEMRGAATMALSIYSLMFKGLHFNCLSTLWTEMEALVQTLPLSIFGIKH